MASENQTGAPSPELLPPKVDLLDRMYTLYATAGFYPTTRTEINEAFGLLDEGRPKVATVRHLDDVYRHQLKADTNNPEAAVRNITRLYVNYAQKARADVGALVFLEREIHDPEVVNYRQSLREADIVPGRAQLARFMDLRVLAQQQSDRNLLFSPLETGRKGRQQNAFDRYTAVQPDPEIQARIELVADMSIKNVMDILPAAINEQRARREFWIERLEGASLYERSAPIAREALQRLGIRPVDK
ncbi:MAG TPA: hypothetical protein VFH39_04645 [Candidatus Saccharimonadales bacterium]|nr:hypothetical protein [Candidatus Saccharimonadales bacterium]